MFTRGNLNIINVAFDKYALGRINHSLFLKATVDNFDINAIQIGVCLKTKKIYMTKEFKQFLKTKQVEIIKYSNPLSTTVRFLEKSQFYKGSYFNVDYELSLIYPSIILSKNSQKAITQSKFDRLTKKSKTVLKKYFNIKEGSFERLSFLNISHKNIDKDLKKANLFYLKAIENNSLVKVFKPKINYLSPLPKTYPNLYITVLKKVQACSVGLPTKPVSASRVSKKPENPLALLNFKGLQSFAK